MAKTNKEVLNQIRDNATAEYQNRVAETSDVVGRDVYTSLNDYPTAKNEFINTLTNKVIKTVFYSKVFNNPLKMLHRGTLEYGYSIEQLFVEMLEKKGFNEHFDGSNTVEGDLIKEAKAKVQAKYIEKNFAYKYKVTISEAQLRTAFTSATGLSDLINQLTSNLVSSAYFDEYEDMKQILMDAAKGVKRSIGSTGLAEEVQLSEREVVNPMKQIAVSNNPAQLVETIRATVGRLSFPSTAYNMAGVRTWTRPEDIILITTPEQQAKMDVNVLAHAFNVSSADVKVRTIIVDELPSTFASDLSGSTSEKQCLGLLADKDFIQAYDTLFETRTFENGERLSTNMFLHKHGIMATCFFANCLALVAE